MVKSADFILKMRPMSKARPRTPKGGKRPYTPESYRQWLADARATLAEWWTAPPLPRVMCLLIHFRGPARGDLDNLAGAVLDAGSKLIWVDDRLSVIPVLALRFTKTSKADQNIYIKVLWK